MTPTPGERSGSPTADPGRRAAWLAGAVVLGLVFVIGLLVVQPFATGPVGFDSASSVIHFQRIVAGQRLEAFVTTTPKPLLTVVYGLLHGLLPDWRVIAVATIAAYAAGVTLAGVLAYRLAGFAAGSFAVLGLVGLQALATELVYAYAVPWALLGWVAAGLLVAAPRPRYGWAGLALMLASLARLETLVVVGAALVALAGWWAVQRLRHGPAPPRRAWLLAGGLAALPVMLLHDWLLAGDPFFWLRVSQVYSNADPAAVATARGLLTTIVRRYDHQFVLSGLAVAGGLALLWRRAFAIALGLLALGPGVAAFLVLLAARGTYVSSRYFAAIDVGVVLAAAVGTGVIVTWGLARLREARSRVTGSPLRLPRAQPGGAATFLAAVATAAGLVAALVAHPLLAPLDPAVQQVAAAQRALDQHADDALGALTDAVDALPGARTIPAGLDWRTGTAPPPLLFGPTLLRPRLVVDLALPLFAVAGLAPDDVVPGPGFLGCADLVFHDRAGDGGTDAYRVLEIGAPAVVGDVTLTPLEAHPDQGWWVLRITRSGAAAAACAGST